MQNSDSFNAFSNAPAGDLAMLGFIHAFRTLTDVLLDDAVTRLRVQQRLQQLSAASAMSGTQIESYRHAVRALGIDAGACVTEG